MWLVLTDLLTRTTKPISVLNLQPFRECSPVSLERVWDVQVNKDPSSVVRKLHNERLALPSRRVLIQYQSVYLLWTSSLNSTTCIFSPSKLLHCRFTSLFYLSPHGSRVDVLETLLRRTLSSKSTDDRSVLSCSLPVSYGVPRQLSRFVVGNVGFPSLCRPGVLLSLTWS